MVPNVLCMRIAARLSDRVSGDSPMFATSSLLILLLCLFVNNAVHDIEMLYHTGRIYDVLIGGAPAILAYAGLSLLLACRRKLESAKTGKDVQDIIDKVRP